MVPTIVLSLKLKTVRCRIKRRRCKKCSTLKKAHRHFYSLRNWGMILWYREYEISTFSTASSSSPTFVTYPSIRDRIPSSVSEQIAVVRDLAHSQCFIVGRARRATGDAPLGRSEDACDGELASLHAPLLRRLGRLSGSALRLRLAELQAPRCCFPILLRCSLVVSPDRSAAVILIALVRENIESIPKR